MSTIGDAYVGKRIEITGKWAKICMLLIMPQIYDIDPDVSKLIRRTDYTEPPISPPNASAYAFCAKTSSVLSISCLGSSTAASTSSSFQPGSKSENFALTQMD